MVIRIHYQDLTQAFLLCYLLFLMQWAIDIPGVDYPDIKDLPDAISQMLKEAKKAGVC